MEKMRIKDGIQKQKEKTKNTDGNIKRSKWKMFILLIATY